MDKRIALGVISGLTQGGERATQNLQNLILATYKLKQDKKIQDQEYKLNELKIGKATEEIKLQKDIIEDAKRRAGGAIFQNAISGNLTNRQPTESTAGLISTGGLRPKSYMDVLSEDYGGMDFLGLKIPIEKTLKEQAEREFQKPKGQRNQDIIDRWQEMERSEKVRTPKEAYIDDIITRIQNDEEVSDEEKKLAGAYIKPEEKTPSWQQQQLIENIKSGLTKGKVTLGSTSWGMPIEQEVTNREEAEQAIGMAKLNPALFEEELKRFDSPIDKNITPDLQAQINRAKAAGYTQEEIDAYLRGK